MEQYKAENTIDIYGKCISLCQSQVYICTEYVITVTKPDADNWKLEIFSNHVIYLLIDQERMTMMSGCSIKPLLITR